MILKLQHVSVFYKSIIRVQFVPDKVTFHLWFFSRYDGSMSYWMCDRVGFLVTCSSLCWLLVSRSQHKEEQVTRNPTLSHIQYDMLPSYLEKNHK